MRTRSPAASRSWLRLAGVLASVVLYVAAFPPLYRAIREPAAAIIMVPIIVAGLLFGKPGGVLVGLATPLLQIPLHRASGSAMPVAALLLVTLPQAVVGATVGTLAELSRRLRESRRALEEALDRDRRAHEELDRAQRLTRIGNWSWDVEAGTLAWSTELHRQLGMPPGARRPTFDEWVERVHPLDRPALTAALAEALRTGTPLEHDFRLIRIDGADLAVRGRFQRGGGGGPPRMLGTVQDVTEERRLQEQLAAAEQRESLGTLAAGMAHELNNPLAAIRASLGFLAEELSAARHHLPAAASAALGARTDQALRDADALRRGVAAFKRLVDARSDPETRA